MPIDIASEIRTRCFANSNRSSCGEHELRDNRNKLRFPERPSRPANIVSALSNTISHPQTPSRTIEHRFRTIFDANDAKGPDAGAARADRLCAVSVE